MRPLTPEEERWKDEADAAYMAEIQKNIERSNANIAKWEARPNRLPERVTDKWPSYSVAELRKLDAPPLTFLPLLGQPGYFVEGMTHLLAASPKAGKTELMVACIKEWCYRERWTDEQWLEMPEEHDFGPLVAYFSEESLGVWAERTKAMDLGDGEESFVVIPAMGMSPKALLAYRKNEQRVQWAHVIVLDTLRAFGAIKDEADSAQMGEAVRPWIEFCQEHGKTLIVLHHTRKAGGEYGEGVSGGNGLVGAFDIILELGREKAAENRRAVSVMGRLVEPQKGVYERVEVGSTSGIPTGTYEMRWIGERKAVSVQAVKPRVLGVLLHEEKQTTTQVRENLSEPRPSTDQVVRALRELCDEGLAERTPPLGQDAVGKTVRWRRVEDE